MKKYVSRGFTLVELMIVIAIIGILAAVLYPAMTGYFERSRDTNRQGALRNISLSLAAYNTDNAKYPATGTNKCTNELDSELVSGGQKYINVLPVDPKNGHGVEGCLKDATNSGFGYKTLTNGNAADASYVLGANMEIKGNSTASKTDYASATDYETAGKWTKNSTQSQTSLQNANKGEWYYTVSQ